MKFKDKAGEETCIHRYVALIPLLTPHERWQFVLFGTRYVFWGLEEQSSHTEIAPYFDSEGAGS